MAAAASTAATPATALPETKTTVQINVATLDELLKLLTLNGAGGKLKESDYKSILSRAMEIGSKPLSRAGAWLFTEDAKQVLLVKHRRTGHYGPPKGRRNESDSSEFAHRDREVMEETGLSTADIQYLADGQFVEDKKNGSIKARYWIGVLRSAAAKLKPVDTKEIESAQLYTIEKATSLLEASKPNGIRLKSMLSALDSLKSALSAAK